MAEDVLNFEQLLSELAEIVKKLEGGKLSLEESLVIYERGVLITKQLDARLSEAETRVEILQQPKR